MLESEIKPDISTKDLEKLNNEANQYLENAITINHDDVESGLLVISAHTRSAIVQTPSSPLQINTAIRTTQNQQTA